MEIVGGADGRSAEDRVDQVLSGLGPRLRRLRRERNLTLEEVAAASGTSVAHLSRLESGARQPSLDGLLRLAFGLGVPVSELVEETPGPEPGTVVRGAEAPFYDGPALRFQPLVPESGPAGLAAFKVVLPADRVDHQHQAHGGQEWLYMLKGRLRLTLGTERTVLEPGDAAFFDGGLPHAFDVLSEEDVELLMVSCVPCTHGRTPDHRHRLGEGHTGHRVFGQAGSGGPREMMRHLASRAKNAGR